MRVGKKVKLSGGKVLAGQKENGDTVLGSKNKEEGGTLLAALAGA